ncbi:MAG: hypothetical protein AUK33_11215 [Flavobacteriaceae bacterium CG2_30_34_30]|nr:collagen-like protein [Flavobacteriia bacterium]OIP49118.1 MAG: hypothetical protein AUK33_11215 [Flavobacteriaceae bacterium CG2_30_34_30]PIQ19597.1 MAG: dihydrolipoamide dehydrogenase [Flavobacteriaceae bacterium CG18_big_fil_WC_8_21_14_2_50_34_36]PIV49997.1 MAG: dihydrolipoamide dehydrogenase [Flavobacteriaceae bacterium CG02_land_8_20_14_3_00_34_13]PIZ07586.1 MAG: dihydrolipoamide dehydrogenase [Flavobacteriaceae bacterium CG_4_10_14_0_8_um_filter_34_31]PJC08243.1 MAG: dihydrolipoamide 
MKNFHFILFLSAFIFSSCEGPQGPPGFDGQDGGLFLGQTFERTVNFQFVPATQLQEVVVDIPTSIEVFESDAILVYRLDEELPNNVDAWSLIPQNFFLGGGDIIQYVYNHTFFDVKLIIDGNFDLSTLGAGFTQNQTFRFVIVPADFGFKSGVDITDYHAVMHALKID